MKLGLILAPALAFARVVAIPAKLPRLDTFISMDERITFGWCRETKDPETCGKRELDHGRCYNFELLGKYMDNNLESLNVTGGRCVIWEHYDCGGDHTGMIMGTDIFSDNLCPGYPWSRVATSIKCCAGDHDAMWCANPGNHVKCTK
ncbi:hypothetical protein EDB81DRAFT_262058 [Dactylonectria macrodidyma]|uniref:Uncharacterized protein n=1 Tax=Dactylonectria macrodidyma TaxID=307937 RepID=A0A9P9JF63_9HYPO|nr:hypothetical protein EDB81DRAFT_262058 [Dactylonectria macrodidyma]